MAYKEKDKDTDQYEREQDAEREGGIGRGMTGNGASASERAGGNGNGPAPGDFGAGRGTEADIPNYTYTDVYDIADAVVDDWEDYDDPIVILASDYYTLYSGGPPRIKEVDLENGDRIDLYFDEAIRVTSVKYKAPDTDSYEGLDADDWTFDYWSDGTPYVDTPHAGLYRIKYVISDYNDLTGYTTRDVVAEEFMNAYLGVESKAGNYTLGEDDASESIANSLKESVADAPPSQTSSESTSQSSAASFTVPDDLELSIDSSYSSFGNVFFSFLQYTYSSITGEEISLEATAQNNADLTPGQTL